MKEYFYHDGSEQQGPIKLEDLKLKKITKNTPVWHEGLPEWTTAGEIYELKEIFKVVPPPLKTKENKIQPPPLSKEKPKASVKQNAETVKSAPRKKKKSGKSFVIILIALIVIGGGVFAFNEYQKSGGGYSGSGSNYEGAYSSSYQEEKMSIEEKEQAYPTDFLDADGTYRENIWGDKLKVNGTITNSATVATYKDATVRITYYSKSNTNLGTEDYVIWDVFKPNTTKSFDLKIKNYSNVNSIGWEVVDASIVY